MYQASKGLYLSIKQNIDCGKSNISQCAIYEQYTENIKTIKKFKCR